ncbi:hypothetical protein ApDm4_1438 [Acetobacter pomorum]|nr:hypothetical protein ApDm4_1438 [Acetobacter pomorum]
MVFRKGFRASTTGLHAGWEGRERRFMFWPIGWGICGYKPGNLPLVPVCVSMLVGLSYY